MPGATACKAPRCGSAAGAPPPCPSSCPPGEATSCKLDAPVTPPSPKETLSPAQPIRLIPTAETLELATNRRPAQREQMPHRTCFLPPTLALTPPNSLPITGSGTTLAFQRQALDLVAAAAVGGAMGCIAGSTAKSAADVAQLLYTHLTFTLLLRKLGLIHIEWHRVCRPYECRRRSHASHGSPPTQVHALLSCATHLPLRLLRLCRAERRRRREEAARSRHSQRVAGDEDCDASWWLLNEGFLDAPDDGVLPASGASHPSCRSQIRTVGRRRSTRQWAAWAHSPLVPGWCRQTGGAGQDEEIAIAAEIGRICGRVSGGRSKAMCCVAPPAFPVAPGIAARRWRV